MEKTLKELAELVGGEVTGNGDILIRGAAPLESASQGDVAFIANPKYAGTVGTTKASAIIAPPEIKVEGKNLILSKNPQLAFAKILTLFSSRPYRAKGIDKRAFIGRNPRIGKDVTIYPFAYIGDDVRIGERVSVYTGTYIGNGCRLGDDVVVYPNAVIQDGCIVGDRVIIHPGAVIGSDGFGFAREGKRHYKIPQVGTVQIDDDVEIGANAAIDRASFGKTRIKRGVKIDNLVQIAHNVEVGEDCIIVAQAGIAGSSRLGDNAILAGQAAVADHVTIGREVMVGGQSGVMSDIPDNRLVSGYPAMPHREWLKATAVFTKLPDMKKEIKELRERVEELEAVLKLKI